MTNRPITDGPIDSDSTNDGNAFDRSQKLAVGDVVIDRAAYIVTVKGRPCVLARQELRLLEMLMANADHVLTSRELLDALWGPDYEGDTLTVHMLRLRKKLERRTGATKHLRTVRGVGYVFDTVPVLGQAE